VCIPINDIAALAKLRQRYQDIEDHPEQAVKPLFNQPRTVKEAAYVTHHAARLARQEILTALRTPTPRSPDPLAAFYTDLERRIDFHQQMAETSAEPPPAPEEAGDAVASESMNNMLFDIKGNAHLSLFYDDDRYREWRRQKKSETGKQNKATKRRIVISENDEALRKFSGEECSGQFFDLYDVHRALCALPANNHPNYIQFLEMLSRNELDFAPRAPKAKSCSICWLRT
jgi:hypothetical protein